MKIFIVFMLSCIGMFVFAENEVVDLRRELPTPDFYLQNQHALKLDVAQLQTLEHTMAEMNRNLAQAEATMAERAKALQAAIKDSSQSSEKVEQKLDELMKVENEVKAIRFRVGLAARRMLRPDQWQRAIELKRIDSRPRTGLVASLSAEKQEELANKLQSLRKLGEQLFPNGPPADLRRRVNEAQNKVRNGRVDEALRLMDDLISELKKRRAEPIPQP